MLAPWVYGDEFSAMSVGLDEIRNISIKIADHIVDSPECEKGSLEYISYPSSLRYFIQCSCGVQWELGFPYKRIVSYPQTKESLEFMLSDGIYALILRRKKERKEIEIEENLNQISTDPIASLEL